MAETTDLVMAIDGEGMIGFASPSVERLLGYAPERLWDRPFLDLVDPAQHGVVRQDWERLLHEVTPGAFRPARDMRFRHRDGSWRVLEAVFRPMRTATGEQGVILNARDLGECHRAEERRQETEQRYHALFDLSPLPMWVHDRTTLQFLAVNDAAIQGYGYTREEFLEMTVRDLRPCAEFRMGEEMLSGDGGNRVAHVWRHRKKNGTVIDVAVRSADVEFGGWPARLVLAEDVTARGRA
jgi:PAS domain S-box-containing protein